MGYWQGIDKIMENYGSSEKGKYMPDRKGGFVWHTITTPVVEIAEDRETAKGIWYTPGIVGEYSEDGTNNSQWMREKYAVEFVRETGEWKIWHMKVYTDFSTTVGEAIGGGFGAPGGGALIAGGAGGIGKGHRGGRIVIGNRRDVRALGADGGRAADVAQTQIDQQWRFGPPRRSERDRVGPEHACTAAPGRDRLRAIAEYQADQPDGRQLLDVITGLSEVVRAIYGRCGDAGLRNPVRQRLDGQ